MKRRQVTGQLVFSVNGGKVLSFSFGEDMAGRIAKAVCDTSALRHATLSDKDMRMWLENVSGTSVKAIARGNALSEQAVKGSIKRVDESRYAGEDIDI